MQLCSGSLVFSLRNLWLAQWAVSYECVGNSTALVLSFPSHISTFPRLQITLCSGSFILQTESQASARISAINKCEWFPSEKLKETD